MAIPFKYTLKNFRARKLTTVITIVGIALVAFVFAAVLMMSYGIKKTLVATGSPDNVIIMRKASSGEISSIIDGETQNVIRTLPYISKNSAGSQIMSLEPVVIINLETSNGGLSNVTVRGISPQAMELRPQVKLVEGRMMNWGVRELIVGESVSKRFPAAKVGNSIKLAGSQWKIVGLFKTGGSGFDSELWGDALQLLNAFNRGNSISTITFKLDKEENFENFKRSFATDRRLQQFVPKQEQTFYAEQSEGLATFIRILGIFITVVFSFGATIGATITMYAAVANRTVEIGTLRSLGFSRRSIMAAFLMESLFISLIGGAVGLILAAFLQFFSISTLNFSSFSEITFKFAIEPSIIYSTLLFAAFMGILGGFLPSMRAAKMNIVKALRMA